MKRKKRVDTLSPRDYLVPDNAEISSWSFELNFELDFRVGPRVAHEGESAVEPRVTPK